MKAHTVEYGKELYRETCEVYEDDDRVVHKFASNRKTIVKIELNKDI
ncbi:hypothetical protein [Clostridium felsineum]|nr:hypothetical protein [Clostridium felsineum]